MTVFTRTSKRYRLIRHILWHGIETCSVIVDEFHYKSEAYEEWDALELADDLDRKEGILPSYLEYQYEVRKETRGETTEIVTYKP